jgi:hypothetical protein
MKNFILFLAIGCGGVSITFYTAAKEVANGPNWASNLCSASRSLSLCQNPRQLAFAGGRLGSTLARDGVCVGNTRLSDTSIDASAFVNWTAVGGNK